MREPEFLKEIHKNQIKTHKERVNAGLTLKDFILAVEKETEEKRKLWGIKKYQAGRDVEEAEEQGVSP